MVPRIVLAAFATILPLALRAEPAATTASDWPPITRECRPWAYNWWMGSAVDQENLARELRRYHDAGLGGIHIIPIYGAKGAEGRFIDYLTPRWMEMMTFAVREGARDDLGVDMSTGTGWCFGGPQVTEDDANFYAAPHVCDVPADAASPWTLPVPKNTRVVFAEALGPEEQRVPLKDKVSADGGVHWQAPGPGWKIAFVAGRDASGVKRPAPGGAGHMLNTVYPPAMTHYLEAFSQAFAIPGIAIPRAMYHDSYEYNVSSPAGSGEWSPDFFEQFVKLRGYRLEEHLSELAGSGESETVARVKSDYRETVSDAMVSGVFNQWADWSHQHGMLTRNQAHGSPANLIDFYALADIPETEVFRDEPDPVGFQKVASSAAHVAGHRLTSSETGTWLAEHFHETLGAMKGLVDQLFVSGINHVFYHGCCYSPDDAPWPGWVFYASTQMNPRNPIWQDAPALNAYIARVQSVLQAGEPDNEALVLYTVHDRWNNAKGLPVFDPRPHGGLLATATQLWKAGVGFDYISDRLLTRTECEAGTLRTPGGGRYRVLIVPPTSVILPGTAEHLLDLAQAGATIIFVGSLPPDVPGLGDLEKRRSQLHDTFERLKWTGGPSPRLPKAAVGKGVVYLGDVSTALRAAEIDGESMVARGLHFIRRRDAAGVYYFIVNDGKNTVNGPTTLATPAQSFSVMDPMTGKTGVLAATQDEEGRATVTLRLEPGQSILLHAITVSAKGQPDWHWLAPGPSVLEMAGPWTVEFIKGGPELPKPLDLARLAAWTESGDPQMEAFGGTARYSTHFDAPADAPDACLLDLGEVHESARARLNGHDLGVAFSAPFRLEIPPGMMLPKDNLLEIEVTNLGANRIRFMDREKIPWKNFYDTNVVNIKYTPLDASQWPVLPSGLRGPVRLLAAAPVP